ncbi:hypothetical protein Q7P37_010067 [Cladosporium fusiforme]
MGQFDRKKQSQPKHGKPNDSGASKAPPRPTAGMPGWKAPGFIKKKPAAKPAISVAPEPVKLEHALPVDLEQRMLEVFRATFSASNDFEALKPTLQTIKGALLRRDYDTAFGKDDHLEAYAIRWSPSCALGYAQLLAWICASRVGDPCIKQLVESANNQRAANVVCFGGGAAELMAFSGLLRYLRSLEAAGRPSAPTTEVSDSLEAMSISAPNAVEPLLHLNLLDMADWASVLSKLDHGLNTPPQLSKYASAAARATNASFLLPGTVKHDFTRADVLNCSTEDLRAAIGSAPALLTLMSTLNELYMASMPRTTAFLQRITEAAPRGSLLLVVDTPGAYSEIAIGNSDEGEEKRKYPMSRLLDYALLPNPTKKPSRNDSDNDQPKPAWEKVIEEASMLYKLEQGLKYAASLENMRFQVHLFRRV